MELAAGCAMCQNDASHLVVEANHDDVHAACEGCAQELLGEEEGREAVELDDVDMEDPVRRALR